MFAAGFADTELRRAIMSGMMGRSLAEGLAVVNNTLTSWPQRSVRMVLYSRHRFIVLITVLQPKSGICVCSSHTKVSLSSSIPTKKIANEPPPL
jgi:hypothetical protein